MSDSRMDRLQALQTTHHVRLPWPLLQDLIILISEERMAAIRSLTARLRQGGDPDAGDPPRTDP